MPAGEGGEAVGLTGQRVERGAASPTGEGGRGGREKAGWGWDSEVSGGGGFKGLGEEEINHCLCDDVLEDGGEVDGGVDVDALRVPALLEVAAGSGP